MNLTLQELFDLQHFEGNHRLQALIDDSMARHGLSDRAFLSDQELSMLYAAGDAHYTSNSLAGQDTKAFSSIGHADLFQQKESR